MPIKGSKGEWSEFYAFIKILTDGKIFTANKRSWNIEKIIFIWTLKVIREESNGIKSCDISKNNGEILIYGQNSGEKIGNVKLEE